MTIAESAPAISDEELTALALAAGPEPEVGDDAVSIWELEDEDPQDRALLPAWYAPVTGAAAQHLTGWRRKTAWALIGAFVAIDAVGLCTTFGPIVHG